MAKKSTKMSTKARYQCQRCGKALPAIPGYERSTWRHCPCGGIAVRTNGKAGKKRDELAYRDGSRGRETLTNAAKRRLLLPQVPRHAGILGLGVIPNLGLVDRAKHVVSYKMTCGRCLEEVDANEHEKKTGHDFFFNAKAFSSRRDDDEDYDGPRRYRD